MSVNFFEHSTLWMILQRLSKSVTMVAKGVLKEHLILLANSMTCAGNLIGFNSGGYKALSRALNLQVPFTEATLFVRKFHIALLFYWKILCFFVDNISSFHVTHICLHRHQENVLRRLLKSVILTLYQALLHHALGVNMWQLVQDLDLMFFGIQKRYL